MVWTAERTGTAWRRWKAAGIGDEKPRPTSERLLPSPTSQTKFRQVPICWNLILDAAIGMLNGIELVYKREMLEGFIQAHVRFRVPIDESQGVFEDVEVAGRRCIDVWEADSSAALNALAELERGPFHIQILDVSRLRCKEMEKSCYQYLFKAGEVYRGVKLLLADWEDTMLKFELCYKDLYRQVVENVHRQANEIYAEISCDVADSIYDLNRASYTQFCKLTVKAEEAKNAQWDVRSRADYHFHGRSHRRPEVRPAILPCEMKLCMEIILDEMITALGWDKPACKFSSAGRGRHGCDLVLLTKAHDVDVRTKKAKQAIVASGEGLSQFEALESACQHAISLLEKEMFVCIADINYSSRAYAEIYVSEAKQVADLAISIGKKIVTEWESLVNGLQTCERQSWNAATNHPEKDPSIQVYNAKCDCAGALADLYGECFSDLKVAKKRYNFLSSWIDQETEFQ